MVGKDIMLRDHFVIEDILPGTDVISGVRVGKHVFPRGGKHQDEEYYQEEELADRRDEVIRFSFHATGALALAPIRTGR